MRGRSFDTERARFRHAGVAPGARRGRGQLARRVLAAAPGLPGGQVRGLEGHVGD